MRHCHLLSSFLVCCVLLLTFGIGTLLPGAALAQQDPLPAPSPRPAVQFIEQSSGDGSSAPDRSAIPGHIGGTVIDVISNAPVPGMPVRVGDSIVVTDQNGNYGIWVVPGTYLVNVAPAPGRGTIVDGPATVVVQPETSVVQHLRVALPIPEVRAVEPAVADAPAEAPRRLPRTNDAADVSWVWVSLGILFIGVGVGLGMLPVGRRALATGAVGIAHLSNQALLQKLLSERPTTRSVQDDALLRKLLELQE